MSDAERKALVLHMLQELSVPAKPLTAWEDSFVESVSEQFHQRGTLSDKQFDMLERIYEGKTA